MKKAYERCIESLNGFTFDYDAYKSYLETWFNGISSELHFWKHYIETKGIEWRTDWKDLISNDRKFVLEKYLNSETTRFLDAGSGPFSSCGLKTSKTRLDFYACDPLAYIYKALKIKNGISTGITPEFAMVERLVEKYGTNNFDIVHMRNALDHSFNPLIGIIQMLSVCKIGGKVILQHAKNEAENANYSGFHQWNICIEISEFVVWRPGIKYNVTKILKGYADVLIENSGDNWVGAVLEKKQKILLDNEMQNKIAFIFDENLFKKLSEININKAYSLKAEPAMKSKQIIMKSKQIIKKIPFLGYFLKILYKKYKQQKMK
jgi:SAM-dependent methyltransferase